MYTVLARFLNLLRAEVLDHVLVDVHVQALRGKFKPFLGHRRGGGHGLSLVRLWRIGAFSCAKRRQGEMRTSLRTPHWLRHC